VVTKKRKKRSRAIKVNDKGVFVLFFLFLGSIISLGGALYYSQSNSSPSPPAFEETYSTTSALTKEITRVDHAIYDSLYQRNIPQKDILFRSVKPRVEAGNEFDFIDLLVRLKDSRSLLQLGTIITRELSLLRPQVSYTSEEGSDDEVLYYISALGIHTHKISLVHKAYDFAIPEGRPKVGMIVDDLGYDCDLSISFMNLDLPLSFSVLPLAPYTEVIVREARRKRRELILHLPMEPRNYPSIDPGPGALFMEMSDKDIRRTIEEHLDRVPGVKGVNNHMGSYFTESQGKMAVVMDELRKRHLFYIDSRTTHQTVAFDLARKMGVPAAERGVFLDNDLSPKGINFQMERLLGIARHSGAAIGIAHPHKETLQVLKGFLQRLKSKVDVVPVSDLVS
jgi:polysaccharide deacetylase 2 family uncharacterized protein YibQ